MKKNPIDKTSLNMIVLAWLKRAWLTALLTYLSRAPASVQLSKTLQARLKEARHSETARSHDMSIKMKAGI